MGSSRRADSSSPRGRRSPATVPSFRYSDQAEPEIYPRATHSMSIRSHRRTYTARPSRSACERNGSGNFEISVSTRWFGTICAVCANQKFESCVSTLPLSGIGVGSTTSNAERRSLATITRCSSPASYTSRTLPSRSSTAPCTLDLVTVSCMTASLPMLDSRSFRQHRAQLLAPLGRDVARDLRGEAAVLLGVVEDAALLGRHLPQRRLQLGIENGDLEQAARAALGLEGEPPHRLVRVRVAVLREEHVERLGDDPAARGREVRAQAVLVDADALERIREAAGGVRDRRDDLADEALRRRVRQVALVLADRVHVRRDDPRRHRLPEALHVLEGHRVALVRHRRAADLVRGERLRDLPDLAALQVPQVVRALGHDPERRDRVVDEIGPALRRDDLRRVRRRPQLQRTQEAALELARLAGQEAERVVRADGAGELARQRACGVTELQGALSEARDIFGELETNGDRLGVPPVRAADLPGLGLRLGDLDAHRHRTREPRHDDLLDALAVTKRVRGVDDVVRRRAEVDEPLRVVRDLRLDDVDQGAHVVARLRLLLRDLRRHDLVARLLDRIGDALGAEPGLRHRARERALDAGLVADRRLFREVRVELAVQLRVTAVEAVIERRDRVEARVEGALAHEDRTFAAIASRIARSRAARSVSQSARISAARMPAFAAPASPSATVATGTPRGICAVDSSASSPPATAFGATSGTPITGSVTSAAMLPARCAAPPAAAMTTLIPRPSRPIAHSCSASGVRCAESTRVSDSTPSAFSVSSATSIVARSDAEPMTMATRALI